MPPTLKLATILKDRLSGARKIAVLGIGSEFRGDDGAGMLVAETLHRKLKGRRKVKIFFGSTAPENLTGEIRKFKPTHLVIIDTIQIEDKPGTVLVLKPKDVGRGATFSTHMMPAKIMLDYLLRSLKCDVVIIGIQPDSIRFGRSISKKVSASIKAVVFAVHDAL